MNDVMSKAEDLSARRWLVNHKGKLTVAHLESRAAIAAAFPGAPAMLMGTSESYPHAVKRSGWTR